MSFHPVVSMTGRTNWDRAFAEAHLGAWPPGAPVGLAISNRNPDPTSETARNVYKDDCAAIHSAASQHGFRLMPHGPNPRAVSFIRSV